MGVGFRTSIKVNAAARIVQRKPESIVMSCLSDFLFPVPLPGFLGCRTEEKDKFEIAVNDSMAPGVYAFAAMVTLPDENPQSIEFSILLYESDGTVQDAAMDLKGKRLAVNLGISSMPLTWTSSDPGTKSELELGFSIDKKLAVDQLFSMVVIKFPDGFMHTVTKQEDVYVTEYLPLLRDGVEWGVHSTDPEDSAGTMLRIMVDLSREVIEELYTIRFPVVVPTNLPPWNIWELYLCKANDCDVRKDYNTLVGFSVVGFEFGQLGPRSRDITSFAAALISLPLFFILF
jgi:hypothetical protein